MSLETIHLKCPCGAEFSRKCRTYINGGGRPDPATGFVFIAEVAAEQWRKDHIGCIQKAREEKK